MFSGAIPVTKNLKFKSPYIMLVRKLALNTVSTKLFLQGHSESPRLKTTAASANQGVLLERLTFRAGRKCCLSSVRQNSRRLIYTQHLQLSRLKFYRVSGRCVFITSRKQFSRPSPCHLFWLACVTGVIFARFSGEQRQARSERASQTRATAEGTPCSLRASENAKKLLLLCRLILTD